MAQIDKDVKELKDKMKEMEVYPREVSPMVIPTFLPRIGRDGHPLVKKEKR